jgi:hypothetical protein
MSNTLFGSIGILQCACFWFNEYWDAWPAIVPTTQFDLIFPSTTLSDAKRD